MKIVILYFVMCAIAMAQPISPQSTLFVTVDPSTTPNSCTPGPPIQINTVNGKQWLCQGSGGPNTGTWTTINAGGATLPSSADIVGSSSSTTGTVSTAHNVSRVLDCAAASASGTAYTCSTSPSFTPATGDSVRFKADVASTGSATLAVNGGSAGTIKKQGGGTNLVLNDLLAGTWTTVTLDSNGNWQMQGQIGNAATGANPAGSFSEIQFRSNPTTFGAETNTGPVPTASWVLHNCASAHCWIDDFSAKAVGLSAVFAATENWGLATQTLPSVPYTVIAQLYVPTPTEVGGLYLYDGTKAYGIEVVNASSGTCTIETRQKSTLGAGGTTAGATNLVAGGLVTFKVSDDGTHRTWYYWSNGAFVQQLQETTATFLTPTSAGPIILANSASPIGATTVELRYWCVASGTTCGGL